MIAGQIALLDIQPETANANDAVKLYCSGIWTVHGIAQLERQLNEMIWPVAASLVINGSAISALDTSGAWLLHRMANTIEQKGISVRITGLRPEFSSLLGLVSACAVLPPKPTHPKEGIMARIGRNAWFGIESIMGLFAFVGESAIAMMRLAIQPRHIRWRTIFHNIQIAGFEALPIVGLLSFLMGVVIAYQGADQLQRFGANIFIADLVGLTMLRELSPLLTAIIIAGRSGSAYAAQIATMKVTEEIDALRTVGVSQQELLVAPKILALAIVLPLLTVYADVSGVLGGMIMASSRLDVSFDVFIDRLEVAISLSSFLTGIVKAPVFALIIALVGCYQGFQVSGSADSVGRQTTLSVVQSIFLVIVADALFSVVFNWLNI